MYLWQFDMYILTITAYIPPALTINKVECAVT